MKKLFLIIIAISLFHQCAGAQWVQQNSGTTQHLYDVYFIDTQTGWACGNNGTLLKTTNGGNDWISQNSSVTFPIYSIHFLNENIGYGITRVDGYFIKTTNGGQNWNTIFFSPKSFEAIFFIDSLTGWAAGISGTGWVFKTTDGGTSWDSVNIVNSGIGRDIEFVNTQTGWVAMGSKIYKSVDGGESWLQQLITNGAEIQSLSFINVNTGYAVSLELWQVFKTTNSGNNWMLLTTLPECFNSHCIFFGNVNTGWVSGDCGQIFSTTNGGLNWYQQQTNTNSFLQSVQFLTDSIGWAVGGGGRIIHTDSMGKIHPVVNISTEVPEKNELLQNYPNPFNSKTVFRFSIAEAEEYRLEVYDLLGRRVEVVFNEFLRTGSYEIKYDAHSLSSGLYLYRLISKKIIQTKKFILIK